MSSQLPDQQLGTRPLSGSKPKKLIPKPRLNNPSL